MPDLLYEIRDWDTRYENSRTRTMALMRWVPVPNRHDGEAYVELMSRRDGTQLLGAWLQVLQVASKCRPRGVLIQRHGEPHTAQTIARLSHGKSYIINKALTVLSHPAIGWVVPSLYVPDTSVTPSRQATSDGREGKGKEEKKPPNPRKRGDLLLRRFKRGGSAPEGHLTWDAFFASEAMSQNVSADVARDRWVAGREMG